MNNTESDTILDCRVVLITTANLEQAENIAQDLVSKKLAACVNIIKDISSIYSWEGKINKNTEFLLIAKTTKDKFESLRTRVESLHNYENPEIISIKIENGSKNYLNWISNSLK